MGKYSSIVFLAVVVSQVSTAPQFITFNEGKLGVNFGGYHAGVGLGGLLGGKTSGGLFAEAGTPYGQAAKAGLGGMLDSSGRTAGGLYAGATAGGNVMAAAGLSGGLEAEKAAGGGFAAAQAGGHSAQSGLGGESSISGSSGFTFSGTKSYSVPSTIVKETEVSVVPIEAEKPVHKKVHTEFNVDAANEINAVPLSSVANTEAKAEVGAKVNVNANAQPAVIVKEVYVEPQTQVVEKHIVHTYNKPHKHHFHKTAYIGGYIGGQADVAPPQAPVVYKTVQPVIEKRIDVGAQSAVNAEAAAGATAHGHGAGDITYRKEITVARNPNFFKDIFDIPISALKSVSTFLTNTAGNTNISVQKSASIQAGAYA